MYAQKMRLLHCLKKTPEMATIPIRAAAISVVIIRRSGKAAEVLLLERCDTLVGEWCQITGGLEPDETAWQGALREVREETGLIPDPFYSANICEQFYVPAQDSILTVPVFVGFVGMDAKVVLNHEHSDFGWFSFKSARALVPFSGQRRVLKQVKRNFVKHVPSLHLRIETGIPAR